jgi:hypothetical protein
MNYQEEQPISVVCSHWKVDIVLVGRKRGIECWFSWTEELRFVQKFVYYHPNCMYSYGQSSAHEWVMYIVGWTDKKSSVLKLKYFACLVRHSSTKFGRFVQHYASKRRIYLQIPYAAWRRTTHSFRYRRICNEIQK